MIKEYKKVLNQNIWLVGCFIVLLGLIPIFGRFCFMYKLIGLIIMFISGIITFILIKLTETKK
ncbi:MAG: hypothetical protein KKF48_02650 [Nanoarchaeota archaeon]|nr:hypothetical protein [Nanoarchaeota archaeon]